jgi:hypothetical protein
MTSSTNARASCCSERVVRGVLGVLQLLHRCRQPIGQLADPGRRRSRATWMRPRRLHWMSGNTIGIEGGEMMGARKPEDSRFMSGLAICGQTSRPKPI